MYCPNCSQQQVSEETRFCSRCGFSLALVAEILAHDGFLPQLAELGKKKKFTRRNGTILALFWCLFFLLMLTPVFSIFRIKELAAMSAVFGVFGGLLILLASIFFLPKQPKNLGLLQPETGGSNPHNLTGATSNALPPQQSIPVSTYVPPSSAQKNWRDTNDSIPSVTEGTTKLLEKDEGD